MNKKQEAQRGSEDCMFFEVNIGAIEFNVLEKHIENCASCQSTAERWYQDYRSGSYLLEGNKPLSIRNFASLPKGLEKRQFLIALQLSQSVKDESRDEAYKKMCSTKGINIIRSLLESHAMMFSMAPRDLSSNVLESRTRLIEVGYKELKELIGEDEFSFLIGDLDQISDGLRLFLRLLNPGVQSSE